MRNLMARIRNVAFLILNSSFLILLAGLMFEWIELRRVNDDLSDDKAALLVAYGESVEEGKRLAAELEKTAAELKRTTEEKAALARSLVKLNNACRKTETELKRLRSTMDETVKRRTAAAIAERERQAKEKARQAAEKAEKEKRERERLAKEREPLRYEELKPQDKNAKVKSGQESLDELLEFTTDKKANGGKK